ncbi:MAG: hypothetical protein JWL83_3590 [Actinomycetia bacterium]|nr:hypothetical protein [Actinomycetes bacterium]
MRLDRRMARALFAATALAAVAVVVVVATTRTKHSDDNASLRDFLALTNRRESASWLVHFRFERRLGAGSHFAQSITEANRPPVHVLSGGGTVTVDFGDHVASCASTPKGPRCSNQKSSPALAPAAVYRVATSLGGYTVHRAPSRTIAGEQAQCFRLVAKPGHTEPSLGDETLQCYAADGVPLRSELHRGATVDSREAVAVQRHVSAAAVNALLRQLDEKQAGSGR